MRTAVSALLLLLSVGQFSAARPGYTGTDAPRRRRIPLGRRSTPLFISPAALPGIPTADAVAALDDPLDTDNIQSDILVGQQKNKELFFFFKVNDAATFKAKLASDIIPLITTTTEVLSEDTQPVTAVNLAFSNTGLVALGVDDELGDPDFVAGQFSEATSVGDDPSTWNPAFAGTNIHGVFLLASDTVDNLNAELASIQSILGSSVTELYSLQGAARPGDEEGHEHFGFMDGISQPAITGFTTPVHPGQIPRLFLLGEDGDPNLSARPGWAKDGAFLVFRQLQQLVPEFNQFLQENAVDQDTLTPEQGSDLLGARMVGRWKSGAPVFLSPTHDDPVLAADPDRNNDFTYLIADALPDPGTENHFNQTNCPFGAHIRKVHPRGDLSDGADEQLHFIIRSSIPYGPEVTSAETASATSTIDRGLAFVAYQASIGNGFVFLQNVWINNNGFPFGKVDPTPGVDPIIGTGIDALFGLTGGPQNISGMDPANPALDIVRPETYVVSRGGEYFFSPSLSGLDHIAAA
ncbi:dye-decolorizing peroxidase precursor [Mycena pura]|uniref:Dye-decolorizing peroxidase n=1 Tax=Mycena pura TaxID=153505 RepID=A0AAD6VAR9_9AGAR|nr:dye-decolorizing peroxidase precursor [Mycena pura]